MAKKIFDPSYKDENGIYGKAVGPVAPKLNKESSIDDLLRFGLDAIQRLMNVIMEDISSGAPERDTVMNLKDCMVMLHDLKKKEKDLLDKLSDEELEQLNARE